MTKIIMVCVAISLVCLGAYFAFQNTSANIAAPTVFQLKYAENAVPKNSTVAEIYDRSCRACHTDQESKAPLTGHSDAWRLRMEVRGIDGLTNSVRTGLEAMPPMGLCNDCSDENFRQLIEFMSKEAS